MSKASRLELAERPRRNRKSAAIRDAVRETRVGPEHFIYPLFVHAGDDENVDFSDEFRIVISDAGGMPLTYSANGGNHGGVKSSVTLVAVFDPPAPGTYQAIAQIDDEISVMDACAMVVLDFP